MKLRNILTIALTAGSFLITSTTLYFYSKGIQIDNIRSLTTYGTSLVQNVAFTSVDFLLMENNAPLQEFLAELVKDPTINELLITDTNGKIIVASTTKYLGGDIESHPDPSFHCTKEQCTKVNEKQSSVSVIHPITFNDENFGIIYSSFSMAETTARIRSNVKTGIMVAFVLWGLSIIFVQMISRLISRPLERMQLATKLIARRDFSGFEIQKGISEVEELGEAMNDMAATIRDRETQLETHQRELEATVKERTRELHDKNELLNEAYSELKASQATLLQREKMASIGQLAAGVAHEINNPMGFISSNLRTLHKYWQRLCDFNEELSHVADTRASEEEKQTLAANSKKMKITFVTEDGNDLLQESLEGADRIKEIVQNLRTFSHIDEALEQEVNLNECLDSTLKVIWNEIKYKAEVIKDYSELPVLKCTGQQLNQVFLNLLMNACQAIGEHGTITITTWHEDDLVCVSINDDGCGMKKEVAKRIFEPFYTTKEVGKGTGLGLSIVYDIVKKHHGLIEVESDEGQGTTFILCFPLG